MPVLYPRLRLGDQFVLAPYIPAVLLLIENIERLVADLGKLRAQTGTAAHRVVLHDLADNVDFLTIVDLVPDALQYLAENRRLGLGAVH